MRRPSRRRARRTSASRSSRCTTGAKRSSRSFGTKSAAPFRMASTAISSPIRPETTMQGTIASAARTMRRAAKPSNPGSSKSASTMSHGSPARASESASAVATRSASSVKPALRSSRWISAASCAESSMKSTRTTSLIARASGHAAARA